MKLTATKVAQELDVSVPTLNNWYKWYMNDDYDKPDDTPELPEYEQAGKGTPRYWTEKDIKKLKIFQAWLPKGRGGVMGDYNARHWGKRGERALKNKRLQNN